MKHDSPISAYRHLSHTSLFQHGSNGVLNHTHPFDRTIASNTWRYCSQLVDPLNQGTFVVVSAACLTIGTDLAVLGVLRKRFSDCSSSKLRCIRPTVSSNIATCDVSSSSPSPKVAPRSLSIEIPYSWSCPSVRLRVLQPRLSITPVLWRTLHFPCTGNFFLLAKHDFAVICHLLSPFVTLSKFSSILVTGTNCNELGVCEGLGGQYHTITNKTQSVKI